MLSKRMTSKECESGKSLPAVVVFERGHGAWEGLKFTYSSPSIWWDVASGTGSFEDPVLLGVPAWMGGPAAGEMTAAQIISKFKRGGIREVFPGELLNSTYSEIELLAKNGVRAAQTAYKLLKQTRFNR